jgi:hypothetical protein
MEEFKSKNEKTYYLEKNLKFKTKYQSFNFSEEVFIEKLFFKYASISPYPKKIKFKLCNPLKKENSDQIGNKKVNFNNHRYNNKFSHSKPPFISKQNNNLKEHELHLKFIEENAQEKIIIQNQTKNIYFKYS